MENEYALRLTNVSHAFAQENEKPLQTLKRISFGVERGKFTSLVGPSGCGKSTLLRIILGLVSPSEGTIERNFTQSAIVFQNFAIFPWLTALENVEFGLKMKGIPQKERQSAAMAKIQEVGLKGFEGKYPKELSGGMRQRVGIARAIALRPDLLLMDEPFSSLDAITANTLKNDIAAIWETYHMTVFMVTHLISEAIELSDQIIVLGKRPASVKSVVDVNLPRPRNTRTPDFFGLVDSITAQIEQ